jgi:hypothetical protein
MSSEHARITSAWLRRRGARAAHAVHQGAKMSPERPLLCAEIHAFFLGGDVMAPSNA